jgi:uncharacterized NAD(P)/FAD-binding protein YdhS
MIELVTGEVAAIEEDGVRLTDTQVIRADAVVLATGNPAPRIAGKGSRRVLTDPWALAALERIGTMLTGPASARLAESRRLAADGDWRGVMEGLRPLTARLWADRTCRPAPVGPGICALGGTSTATASPQACADAMNRLEASGRLSFASGRVESIGADADSVTLNWRPRDGSQQPPITGQWLIDCTGPGHAPADDPVTGPLIKAGRARLDPLGIGSDLDAQGRVLGSDSHLYALGPPARAAFWETTAVPDIRKRIEALVEVLSA